MGYQALPPGKSCIEHRTFSEGTIVNALLALESLLKNAQARLVSHSRGELVADLLSSGHVWVPTMTVSMPFTKSIYCCVVHPGIMNETRMGNGLATPSCTSSGTR